MIQEWVKISTSFFDSRKIKLLEAMPDGDFIILCWVRLIILARITNNNGLIYLDENIPYSSEMLAAIWNKEPLKVNNALVTLQKFKMIDIEPGGIILIPKWDEAQYESSLEKIRIQTKIRTKKYRERQQQLALKIHSEKSSDVTSDAVVTSQVTQCDAHRIKNKRTKNNILYNNIYTEFLKKFNEITGRKFKKEKKSQGHFNTRMREGYDLKDIEKAIKSGFESSKNWPEPSAFTPEYILRPDKLQKYINYKFKRDPVSGKNMDKNWDGYSAGDEFEKLAAEEN